MEARPLLAALALPRDVAVDSSGGNSTLPMRIPGGFAKSPTESSNPLPAVMSRRPAEPRNMGTCSWNRAVSRSLRTAPYMWPTERETPSGPSGTTGSIRSPGDSLGRADCPATVDPAAQACVSNPRGVAIDKSGAVYIADTNHNSIRVVRQGIISTFTGNGQAGYAEREQALLASLNAPQKIAVDAGGSLYIADTGNHVVRVVAPDGTISTLAGIGSPGFSGDGSIATNARLNSPAGVVSDAAGNISFADTLNDRVRAVLQAAPQVGTEGVTGVFEFTGSAGGPPTPAQRPERFHLYKQIGIHPALCCGAAGVSGRRRLAASEPD